jgi:hypothetical protein
MLGKEQSKKSDRIIKPVEVCCGSVENCGENGRGTLDNELERMEKNLSAINDIIVRLDGILEPILMPDGTLDKACREPMPVRSASPLADILTRFNYVLQSNIDRLNQIHSRVDL